MPYWAFNVVTGLVLIGLLYAAVCIIKPFGLFKKRWQAGVGLIGVFIIFGVVNSIPLARPSGIEAADWTQRTALCGELNEILRECLQRSLTKNPTEAIADLQQRLVAQQSAAAQSPPDASTAENSDPEPTANAAATSDAAAAPPPRPPSRNWTYRSDVDEMRDTAIHHACTESRDQVHLGWPYGSQRVRLCVRQHPRFGQDVIVRLNDEGQFLCSSYDGCTVRVRFDQGEVSGFSASGPSDNSTNSIFIQNDERFLRSLKSASRVIVEAEFYQAGSQQMTFETAGLEWPRP